jgi:phosphatidylinositol alpha-1,6-mannosyltransferase
MTYVSEWCRDRISPALSDEAASRMVRLSPGVDTDRFYPGCGGAEVRKGLGISEDAPVVVCTARMIKRKGQDTLVEAWPAVLREFPDAVLLLVGDGPYRARVERFARRLGVEDSVIFTGSVPWEEMPAYTDAGDVFAMPCRTRLFGLEAEAFGIVFLEAAACGLPVIAGDSGGAPEVVAALGSGTVHPTVASAFSRGMINAIGPRRLADGPTVSPADSTPSDWTDVSERLRELLIAG